MQFMMFVVVDPTAEPYEQSDDNDEEWVEQHDASGVRLQGERLRPATDATTVRVRGGKTLLTDGPFTESKEWIAGFDLLECDNLEQAIEVAAGHPMARFGCIEVRAVWPFEG